MYIHDVTHIFEGQIDVWRGSNEENNPSRVTYGPIIELLLYSRRFHLCAYGLIYWPLLGRVGLFSLLVWRPSRGRFGPRSSRTRHHHLGCCLYSWWLYFNWDLELHFKIMNQALVKFWLLMDQTSMDLKNIIVEWVALLRVSHVFQVEMAEACPFWPMIRVRSGWISREEAGLKAHDEVKRASSRINANASRVQYTPSCTTMCTERSRDPTTTGDDLVIRNNADAFSDNSSRINACQGFHCTAATATYKISSIFI